MAVVGTSYASLTLTVDVFIRSWAPAFAQMALLRLPPRSYPRRRASRSSGPLDKGKQKSRYNSV